ncbi:MAG: type II toxin-antitoxin system PemK/MazF family toxin [Bifidobacteriaceae bacterium]|nr:type II toxin-antitoxin system PemK/MazF family toxin [Bifidobacteriaceae bacterium]
MKPSRGDIVTAAAGPYSSKPRPVLVIQDTGVHTGSSVVIIPFTSTANSSIAERVAVKQSSLNGLDRPCWLETDKISAIRSSAVGQTVGRLEPGLMELVEEHLGTLLGMSRRSR